MPKLKLKGNDLKRHLLNQFVFNNSVFTHHGLDINHLKIEAQGKHGMMIRLHVVDDTQVRVPLLSLPPNVSIIFDEHVTDAMSGDYALEMPSNGYAMTDVKLNYYMELYYKRSHEGYIISGDTINYDFEWNTLNVDHINVNELNTDVIKQELSVAFQEKKYEFDQELDRRYNKNGLIKMTTHVLT